MELGRGVGQNPVLASSVPLYVALGAGLETAEEIQIDFTDPEEAAMECGKNRNIDKKSYSDFHCQ